MTNGLSKTAGDRTPKVHPSRVIWRLEPISDKIRLMKKRHDQIAETCGNRELSQYRLDFDDTKVCLGFDRPMAATILESP